MSRFYNFVITVFSPSGEPMATFDRAFDKNQLSEKFPDLVDSTRVIEDMNNKIELIETSYIDSLGHEWLVSGKLGEVV